jgi:hypothetical protein
MHLLYMLPLIARWLAEPPAAETCWHWRQEVHYITAGGRCGHCGADLVPF